MNDDAKPWKRFARTVTAVSASSLALEELRGLDVDGQARAPSESFIGLAAAAEGPRERIELRNARRDLAIVLSRADGGVEVEIATSGFAAIRHWGGARCLLSFANSGTSAMLLFDDKGRATQFLAGADIAVLARDTVTLDRI